MASVLGSRVRNGASVILNAVILLRTRLTAEQARIQQHSYIIRPQHHRDSSFPRSGYVL